MCTNAGYCLYPEESNELARFLAAAERQSCVACCHSHELGSYPC